MAGSQLANIIAFVRGTLEAIEGVGHAYDYQPVATKPDSIPLVMQADGKINYWTVTCESTEEARLTNVETELTHALVIRGYRQVETPSISDPLFQALCTTIADVFRPTHELPGDAELFGPMQFPQRGQLRLLAGTFLVHYAEGRLQAQERVSP